MNTELLHAQARYLASVARCATAQAPLGDDGEAPSAKSVEIIEESGEEDARRHRLTGLGGFLIVIHILLGSIALSTGALAIMTVGRAEYQSLTTFSAWQLFLALIYLALMWSKRRIARPYAIAYHLGGWLFVAVLTYGPSFLDAFQGTVAGGGLAFAWYWWRSKRVRYTFTH